MIESKLKYDDILIWKATKPMRCGTPSSLKIYQSSSWPTADLSVNNERRSYALGAWVEFAEWLLANTEKDS